MRPKLKTSIILLSLVVLAAAGTYLYLRPVPSITPVSRIVTSPKTQTVSLPWPAGGQAAIGAQGYGVLETKSAGAPAPVASIAKIITALAVLKQKPLAAGEPGPVITLDSTDLDYFNYYYTNGGSVAKVTPGEKISQYQALQAMLIPSANNVADSLARWAFGSVDAYVVYANKMVKDMGLANTKVGDASGFADNTTSTADEVVELGLAALNNPVIAGVVSQSSAQVPVAGTLKSTNFLLGRDGVVGIKTGNTDKAGGCYLFAAQINAAGKPIKLVGAILGQSDLAAAINSAPALIQAGEAAFQKITVIKKGQTLGSYTAPWGSTATVTASKDLSLVAWKGSNVKVINNLESVDPPSDTGSNAGIVTAVSAGQTTSSPVLLSQDLPGPSWTWRVFRR